MKTLVVDDNPSDRKILRYCLERHGCEIAEAPDGEEGLEAAGRSVPDLIISDALMPKMDGFQFLRKIKSDPQLRGIPFIFYSSVYTGPRDEQLALSLGADAFIVKPKEPEELWREISAVMEKRKPARGGSGPEPIKEEGEYLKQYALTVTAKIEEKVRELEKANAEIRDSRERLRNLSAHLQSVREKERSAIAREIHDELGQMLAALQLEASLVAHGLREDQAPLAEKVGAMARLIEGCVKTVQRISSELRPVMLDDLGLAAAMEWQAREFEKRSGIRCEIAVSLKGEKVGRELSTAIFRIFQEALTNVLRHAHATKVETTLMEKGGRLELAIRDNGRGITGEEADNPLSLGLVGMRERAEMLGGRIRVCGSPGKGTVVAVRIPVAPKGGLPAP